MIWEPHTLLHLQQTILRKILNSMNKSLTGDILSSDNRFQPLGHNVCCSTLSFRGIFLSGVG